MRGLGGLTNCAGRNDRGSYATSRTVNGDEFNFRRKPKITLCGPLCRQLSMLAGPFASSGVFFARFAEFALRLQPMVGFLTEGPPASLPYFMGAGRDRFVGNRR